MNNKTELINNLINLTNEVDLKNININQIKLNINKLFNIYLKLKRIWKNLDVSKIRAYVYSRKELNSFSRNLITTKIY